MYNVAKGTKNLLTSHTKADQGLPIDLRVGAWQTAYMEQHRFGSERSGESERGGRLTRKGELSCPVFMSLLTVIWLPSNPLQPSSRYWHKAMETTAINF